MPEIEENVKNLVDEIIDIELGNLRLKYKLKKKKGKKKREKRRKRRKSKKKFQEPGTARIEILEICLQSSSKQE